MKISYRLSNYFDKTKKFHCVLNLIKIKVKAELESVIELVRLAGLEKAVKIAYLTFN